MHEILVPDCSEARKNIEQCASYLYHDFGQIVTPIMGGPSVMVDFASRFPRSKIRLLGSSKKFLKSTLLYTNKKRPLGNQDKRMLVKFASALARGMNLPLPSSENAPLNYEEIFPGKESKEEEDDEENFEPKETKTPEFLFIEFDLNNLVKNKVGAELILPQIMSNNVSPLIPLPSDKKLLGVNFSELLYDKESGAIVRELFGYSFLDTETKKMRKNCISPNHTDTRPSMDVIFKPLVWRNSAKIMSLISKEQDQALENMCRGETTTIKKCADNAALIHNFTVITYLCEARCYSTRCKFSSVLTNVQIKQLK